ncbi:PIG-M-domain-containing protein [Tirmania nivea]|nr:PIG-M-domain-containing protein [Tirmania nivea]
MAASVATKAPPTRSSSRFDPLFRPLPLLLLAGLLRIGLLLYGLHQDSRSAVKYTDIDYHVFTDAARFVSLGQSPYARETYRYTPLLAWLLLPTAWGGVVWFSFGKALFAAGDVVAGWGLLRVLCGYYGLGEVPAGKVVAAVWLWNPMVAVVSTRGSSEGLLGAMVVGLVWAVLGGRVAIAGALLGLCVHWKIYPVVYAVAVVWWMGGAEAKRILRGPTGAIAGKGDKEEGGGKSVMGLVLGFVTKERLIFGLSALGTFSALNIWMYSLYGPPFLAHTYTYHLSRLDHRHNFSPYHTLLYLVSGAPPHPHSQSTPWTALPFLPQILLSTLLLPLAFSKHDLPTTLFAQTFAFVTFNKVCTSQYFMWYLVLLPFYLPRSAFCRNKQLGLAALAMWVLAQAAWLACAYRLEFEGVQVFFPGLWAAGIAFFAVNCWVLGVVVGDLGEGGRGEMREEGRRIADGEMR